MRKASGLNCYLCGGKGCKYENWTLYDNNAIDGLYSNWYLLLDYRTTYSGTHLYCHD
jgi:hypothetical protein